MNILLGAGGHAKVIIDLIYKRGEECLLFDDIKQPGETVLESKIVGPLDCCKKYRNNKAVIAVGNNKIRKSISGKYDLNYSVYIHPSAEIGHDVVIGEGTVIMAKTVINSGCKIGRHCIVNTGAIIDHDCTIEDYVHICPGVNLAGSVIVEELCWIGIGSVLINNIRIGKNITLGGGAVVNRDLRESGIYVGCPARLIKGD